MAESVDELLALTKSAVAARDVAAVVSLYHENACITTLGGRFAVGRAAITEHLAKILPGVPQDVVHDVTSEHVHFVTSNLAICDSVGETHSNSASGEDEVRSVEAFTLIAVRDRGEWLWAGLRAILLPK
jgi:uncharacterized protein (TIGR02246 family)